MKTTPHIPQRVNRAPQACLFVAAFALALLITSPAIATIRNGSFTNNGAGWFGFPGGGPTNGSPRVITNTSPPVAQIGSNSVAGVPGVTGGKINQSFKCDDHNYSYCSVSFTANFTSVNGDKAYVSVGATRKEILPTSGAEARTISAEGECNSTTVSFYIVPAKKGGTVDSVLEISAVSNVCETRDHTSTQLALATFPFGQPRTPGYPLPLGSGATGEVAVAFQPGLSPLADPLSSGNNSLDGVLAALDGTLLYKYNPQTTGFDNYSRSGGQWQPPGGTLGPGQAAFLNSPSAQGFNFGGHYVALPFGTHPLSGSGFFVNPVPWPAWFEEVTGFKPVLGDVLVTFKHGTGNGWPPEVDSTFLFDTGTFGAQPQIEPGETVQVLFGNPRAVPLTASQADGQAIISAAGGLPSEGLLQVANTLSGPWQSLMGVADFYSEAATNRARFFRLGFNVPTGFLFGHLATSTGQPASGVTMQLGPNGALQNTDNNGNFTLVNVPAGLVDLVVNAQVWVVDALTGQSNQFNVNLPVSINVTASQAASVNLKQQFTAQVLKPPSCDCVPWCGIVGGTVNGVQTVVAGGGKYAPNCNGVAMVTITGPGGINDNLGQGGQKTYAPAANGVWTVTATVCGITKTSTITLP